MLPQSPFNNPPLSVFLKGWWSCRVRKRLHLFWWKIKLQRHHHLIYVAEPQVEKKRGEKRSWSSKKQKSFGVWWGLRPKTPEGDVWVPVERVRPRQASSRLRGIEVGGPSAPAGCRILPSQIQAGLLGLTLLYKDTRGGDKTIISDYERTNSDTYFQHSENSEQ